ncbi:MAG: dynamin family protein [Pseudonocardiaceae bacterium]
MHVTWRSKGDAPVAEGQDQRSDAAITAEASGLVLELCRAAGNRLRGKPAAFAQRVAAELAEPQIRIGVVGRVSSGKSTLVNSVLGHPVAPTDAGECTRVLTVYRHGDRLDAVVHLRNGRTLELPAPPPGEVVPELPLPPEDVAYLEVRLPSEPLRTVTLIDSPGISSGSGEASQQTHDLVSSRNTDVPGPDAIAFVLTQNLREDEYQLLHEVDLSNTLTSASVHSVGVLTKADLVGGGGPDAWQSATALARSIAESHRTLFAAVVPVIGLLAEAGNCVRLTDDDARLLSTLAREWGQQDRETVLLAPATFTAARSSVTEVQRHRLIATFGIAGVRALLRCIDDGVTGARALNAACRRASGYDELEAALVYRFRERADALKACRALSALLRAVHGRLGRQMSPADRTWLHNRIESVRFDPRTHHILELEALHKVLAGQVTLPDHLERDLVDLVDGGAQRSGALGLAAWQEFEAWAISAGQRALARVIIRSYAIVAESP